MVRNATMTILIFITVLGALGILSMVFWELPVWTHILVWASLSVGLAVCIVKLLESARVRKPTVPWVVGLVALLTLMLSVGDIVVSGLKWVGAWVPIAVPEAGILGGLGAGTMIISTFGGPAVGALIGQLMSLKGWGWRRIATAIALAVIGVLMVLVLV